MKPTRPWYTRTWLHVAIILVVAGLFRLWQLQAIPPGLFGDEATDGLDALDVLAGRGAVFFPANFGREGLHMWIVAAMFRLLGVTPLALRLPSALAGIATALATYWLGREMLVAYQRSGMKGIHNGMDERRSLPVVVSLVPLLAALYLATSFWHVHFSRFGIRGVFTPLCAALAFAAFWRAVNAGDAAVEGSAGIECRPIFAALPLGVVPGEWPSPWAVDALLHGQPLLARFLGRVSDCTVADGHGITQAG